MKHPIFSLMKTYQAKLDRSLSLREKLTEHNEWSQAYKDTFSKLLNVELECQELDYKIYWHFRSLKNNDINSEYYNHLKYNQNNDNRLETT